MRNISQRARNSNRAVADMRARVLQFSSSIVGSSLHGKHFDAVVIGGGHNGLVAVSVNASYSDVKFMLLMISGSPSLQAGYLAKAGKSVAVLERRAVLGGAAVTEEIIPGALMEIVA